MEGAGQYSERAEGAGLPHPQAYAGSSAETALDAHSPVKGHENARRKTLVIHGRLARRTALIEAARTSNHGLQIMSFEQAAARLAGGFVRPIDPEALRTALHAVLPQTKMGELEDIKMLPGMVDAAAQTLHKAWRAGIDLGQRRGDHKRLDAIASLEAAVLAELPAGMHRPSDIVALAMKRLHHAPAVLGPIDISGLTEMSPCWRPLLKALASKVPVRWNAGPRDVPAWLTDLPVQIERAAACAPAISSVSAASAYHEAIEAMRWARALLAQGVPAAEIAIAAATPADYNGHFLALRADANLDLHFVHGVPAISTRDGQAAAALADIFLRGLTRTRLQRLAAHCRDQGLFAGLPKNWLRVLPSDAPLSTPEDWTRLLARLGPEDWPEKSDKTPLLQSIVDLLHQGPAAAAEIGEKLLTGRALVIWRKALSTSAPGALEKALESINQNDGLEPCVSVCWMPASALAASPRRYVRLLGLNSSRWPRGLSEDRLLPDHVVATSELDPLPVNLADRRDFATILAATEREVVLSRARRDAEGRLLGRSPMIAILGLDEAYLGRNAAPVHAFSETDRLLARPQEFATLPQALSGQMAWRNWGQPELTAHDGLVRPDHPLVLAILARTQSASSLKALLRNPIGFLWRYAFGWKAPELGGDVLALDALAAGDLVHRILDRSQTLRNRDRLDLADAVDRAIAEVEHEWVRERPTPPAVLWRRTLADIRVMALWALGLGHGLGNDAQSFSEAAFGGAEPKSANTLPWDAATPVAIPGTGFRIAGYIDHLDIAGDRRRAVVRDYKTGKAPADEIRLDEGRELQRCLYAFAAKALLGTDVAVNASLVFLRDGAISELWRVDDAMTELATHLEAARTSFVRGAALPGADADGDYDDLAFALPANARATYCLRKQEAVMKRMGDAARIWEAL